MDELSLCLLDPRDGEGGGIVMRDSCPFGLQNLEHRVTSSAGEVCPTIKYSRVIASCIVTSNSDVVVNI